MDGELICCACGRKSAATPEEEGQAARADEAWEREQNRSEIRHWLTHRGARPEAADDVEALTCTAMGVDMEGWTHGEIRDAVAVVLAAAGWKVDESALTAEAKIRDLAVRADEAWEREREKQEERDARGGRGDADDERGWTP